MGRYSWLQLLSALQLTHVLITKVTSPKCRGRVSGQTASSGRRASSGLTHSHCRPRDPVCTRSKGKAITDCLQTEIYYRQSSMGAESLGAVPEDTKFTDPKVCRNFLCGTCPHDLFTNTVRCSVHRLVPSGASN